MSWISSRKKACDKCGKRMLNCDVVYIEGARIDLCVPCAKAFMSGFEQWKKDKDAKANIPTDKNVEITSNLPYVNCTECGGLIMPCIMGFSEQLRDAKICMSCMEKKVMNALKGVI